MEPEYTPERTIHLYHRGLPLALISQDGDISWHAEYDEWGNVLREDNPSQLEQLIRLPGQQYDEESGLHYNRHRYYSPGQGRYITQDPMGLAGGWNLYKYPFNPVLRVDPLGLFEDFSAFTNAPGIQAELSKAMITEPWYMNAGETRILMSTLNNMINWRLVQSDKFFHCTAFCRVSKSRNTDKFNALIMGIDKEIFDHMKNIFGLYGNGEIRSESVMLSDSIEDLKVNYYGLTYPPEQACSSRCEGYLNPNHKKTKSFLKSKGYLDN
ncbi:RHS repeat protein [Salmonella enterica subsp. salamae]|nr:RHS repeat protein [Salmonella enterica subsp. salamae]